jgi:hypothetical protein
MHRPSAAGAGIAIGPHGTELVPKLREGADMLDLALLVERAIGSARTLAGWRSPS